MTTRWFVEVSPVDADTLKERYCVEALQWQQALQQARKLRGDRGPLSRFAIELLEAGYRATDPSVRIRYTVSRAPGDAPLTGVASANGAASRAAPKAAPVAAAAPSAVAAVPAAASAAAPATSPVSAPPAAAPATAPAPRTPSSAAAPASAAAPSPVSAAPTARAAKTVAPKKPMASKGALSAQTTSPAVPRPFRAPPESGAAPAPAPAPAEVVRAAVPEAPVVIAPIAPAPPPAVLLPVAEEEEPIPSLPGLSLISRRSEEPREGAPITYREYAFAVEPGLTPKDLERYARAAWEQVRTMLAPRVSGKFVQIALFDHAWTGRPERPPVAVLAWKDWRGDPVLQTRGAGAPTAAAAPPAPVAPAPVAPVPQTPVTQAAPPVAEPPPMAFVPEPALAPPAPAFPAPSMAAEPVLPAQSAPLPLTRARPLAPVETASGRRGPSEDLISELFEEMHQLHFMPDIVTGAEYVLNVLGRVLPCEGVLVHVFDINTRQFVVVRAVGPTSRSALLHRTPDTFALFRETFRRARALSFIGTNGDESGGDGRWELLGIIPRAALCGAVQQGGRYLGVIELANPKGSDAFHDSEVNAVDYICEQFADFVASRPIVLDDEAVIPKA